MQSIGATVLKKHGQRRSFSHRDSKDRLLKIADEYERLALYAEQRQTPETQDHAPQLAGRLNDSPSRAPAADSN
jgi:hypothetical protein